MCARNVVVISGLGLGLLVAGACDSESDFDGEGPDSGAKADQADQADQSDDPSDNTPAPYRALLSATGKWERLEGAVSPAYGGAVELLVEPGVFTNPNLYFVDAGGSCQVRALELEDGTTQCNLGVATRYYSNDGETVSRDGILGNGLVPATERSVSELGKHPRKQAVVCSVFDRLPTFAEPGDLDQINFWFTLQGERSAQSVDAPPTCARSIQYFLPVEDAGEELPEQLPRPVSRLCSFQLDKDPSLCERTEGAEESFSCSEGWARCGVERTCYANMWHCDGVFDCFTGADEADCV